MRKSRFSEEQIIGDPEGAPGGAAGGGAVPQARHQRRDVLHVALEVRRHGGRRTRKRLKALEEENRKLKKLLAEQMLDAATLREMLAKNF